MFRSLYSPPQLPKNITTISSLCFSNSTEHIKVVTKDQFINYRDKNWYVLYLTLIIVIGCLILMIVSIKSKRVKSTHQSILYHIIIISSEKKAYQYPQFSYFLDLLLLYVRDGYSSFNYYEVDNPFGTAKSFTLLLFSNVCFKLSDMQFYLYTENVSLMQQRLKKCGMKDSLPIKNNRLFFWVLTSHIRYSYSRWILC